MLSWRAMADDADAREVARAIGMKMYPKGRNTFILCPGHEIRLGKPDTNPTNAVISKDGYYCFGCGCFIRTPEMVSEFLGCDTGEALRIIADTLGGEDLYAEDLPWKKYLTLTENQIRTLRFDPMYDGQIPFSEILRETPDMAVRLIRKRAAEMEDVYKKCLARYQTVDGAYELFEYAGTTNEVKNRLIECLQERIRICSSLKKFTGGNKNGT